MFLFKNKKNKPQPEQPDVKIATAYTLAVIVFKRLYGHNQKKAEDLAFITVENWIIENKLDKAIKKLWKWKAEIV